MTSPRDVVGAVLPKNMSQTRRDVLSDEILDALEEAGLLLPDGIAAVEVSGARMTVQTVEAYGLMIEVDALGDAVQISSPQGLEIVE